MEKGNWGVGILGWRDAEDGGLGWGFGARRRAARTRLLRTLRARGASCLIRRDQYMNHHRRRLVDMVAPLASAITAVVCAVLEP